MLMLFNVLREPSRLSVKPVSPALPQIFQWGKPHDRPQQIAACRSSVL